MKMTPELAANYVNAGDEVTAGLARAYLAQWLAVRDLYYSARWAPDRDCNTEQLWSHVRDAFGFNPANDLSAPTEPAK